MTTIDDHDIRVALTDASLDAPRVDLWERIDEQVLGMSRKRRPLRSGLRSLAAVLAILLAGAGMLTIFSLADDPDQHARQIDAVPDLLLMNTYDEQTQQTNLRAYLPESDGLLNVLDGISAGERPVISQDGQQILYTGWRHCGRRISPPFRCLPTAPFPTPATARRSLEIASTSPGTLGAHPSRFRSSHSTARPARGLGVGRYRPTTGLALRRCRLARRG